MSNDRQIRVCLKCRKYIIISQESSKNLEMLNQFNNKHAYHMLITTDYNEIDNLECGKVRCEAGDHRRLLHLVTSEPQD